MESKKPVQITGTFNWAAFVGSIAYKNVSPNMEHPKARADNIVGLNF
jgi:hypothetical protein